MGEQRSWDSRQHGNEHWHRREQNWEQCAAPDFSGRVVRIVEWREEWPPQEEVPQANEERMYDGVHVVVHTGVPQRDGSGGLCLECTTVNGGAERWCEINRLRPIPPKPETASGEVIGTLTVDASIRNSYAHGLSVSSKDQSKNIPQGTYLLIKPVEDSDV